MERKKAPGRVRLSFEMSEKDITRFWRAVDRTNPDGCWVPNTSKNPNGYGQFGLGPAATRIFPYAHRVSYFLAHGELTEGKVIDHLCRNRGCINPDHLREVTQGENVLAGVSTAAANARKTHCPKGHPYAGCNVSVDKRGSRNCRTCQRDLARAYRKRMADAKLNPSATVRDKE